MTDPHRPWLKFYDEGVPQTLEASPLVVPDFLRHSAQNHPSQVATVFLGGRLTYRQLQEQVNRFATALAALGVKAGDRVAIMLPNCPQTIISYYATLSLGAVAVMSAPALALAADDARPEREVRNDTRDIRGLAVKRRFPARETLHIQRGRKLVERPEQDSQRRRSLFRAVLM